MFKRKQQEVSDGAKHWYQDKYQHVLTQRNILALIAIGSLSTAMLAAFAVMRLAPLKSVEPYLIQVDEKTGFTQSVNALGRDQYASDKAVDKFFTATYLRMRESYNYNILRYNYNVVRLMSTPPIFNAFRKEVNPENEDGYVKKLGSLGQRDIRIRSMIFIENPSKNGKKATTPTSSKIIQARATTIESSPNSPLTEKAWVITVTFEYADLKLDAQDQLHNPLGYTVTSYQIQPEVQ